MKFVFVNMGRIINVEAIQSVEVRKNGCATVQYAGRTVELNSLEWHNLKAAMGITESDPIDYR